MQKQLLTKKPDVGDGTGSYGNKNCMGVKKPQVSREGLEVNALILDKLKSCFCRGKVMNKKIVRMQKCKICGQQDHTHKVCRTLPTSSPTKKTQPTGN